ELVIDTIKQNVETSTRGKFGMWCAKPMLKKVFEDELDPGAYGGAPLLGLNEVSIVCHGGASAKAIFNGIRVARKFVDDGMISKIRSALNNVYLDLPGGYEDGIWGRMGMRFGKEKIKKKDLKSEEGSDKAQDEIQGG
ncbi:MAG: hypothetical protein KDD53_06720, partial [Bdellovibrionales bacterium]|nr:hypothetical protein [Bdellovibrionales bacterium]